MSALTRLELAQLTRGALARAGLAVFVVLIGLALWAGVAEHSRWTRSVAATRAETERVIVREQENVRLQRQESFNPPGAPSGQSMDASLPPAPGVVLAIGDASHRPLSASVNTSSRADTLFKNVETESPLSASLGALDLTWVVVVLLPLLVIALGHDLLAAERDSARLGLLRAQATSIGKVVLQRLALHLAIPLMLVSAGATVAVALGTAVTTVALWWLIASLYLLLWGLATALVSVRASSAQSAATTLLLLWLTFVVVLPAALALAIERLAPVASRLSQVIAMREVQLSLQARSAELLDRYLTDHPELVGASRSGFGRASFVAARETEGQLAPVLARFAEARKRQGTWNRRLAWLSPPMLAHAAMTHVAGTDSARHDAFVDQTLDFAAAWREHLHERLFLDRKLSAEELAALPRFEFREPRTLSRARVALVYLLVSAAALALLLRRALSSAELR